MTTKERLLEEARKEIGYREQPAGSNRQKFAIEAGHTNGLPWCASFTSALLKRVGLHEPNSAGTAVILSAYKRLGRFDQHAEPGALVIYDFPGERVRNDPSDHIGFVEKVNADGTLTTIEGNTSSSEAGSQSNGGGVFRRNRPLTYVVGFGHPAYQEDEMTPQQEAKLDEAVTLLKEVVNAVNVGGTTAAGQNLDAYAKERFDQVMKALSTLQTGGVDAEALADAVADKLAARLKS